MFLGDEEMAIITRTGVEFTDFFGRPVSKATQRVLWDPIMAEKAGYKHFMLKEIFEQPTAARETILGRVSQDSGKVFLEEMKITDAQFAAVEKVTILACGTSWHAALVGKYLIEKLARIPVEVDYGSEYRYRSPIVPNEHARRRDHPVGRDRRHAGGAARGEARRRPQLSICNVVGSMATRETDGTIYTHAGPEIGVASTKAFTSQLVALYLLALRLGQARGVLSPEASKPHIDALLQLPLLLEQTLKLAPEIEEIAGALSGTDRLPVSRPRHQLSDRARGRAEAEGDLLHPRRGLPGGRDEARADRADRRAHAGGDASRRVDDVFEKMIGNMQEVKARGGSVIALTTRGDEKLSAILDPQRDFVVEVPRGARAADADRHDAAAAAAGVRHRRPPRLRRRSAAQPRQERHGRVGAGFEG